MSCMLVSYKYYFSTCVLDDLEKKKIYNISVFLRKEKMVYIGLCKVHLLHTYLQVCEIWLGFDVGNGVHFVFCTCSVPGIRVAHLGLSENKTL